VRALVKAPGFAAVVVLTLALGIGANAAIFTVLHAVVLEPLHYRQPDRLVELTETIPAGETPTGRISRSRILTGAEIDELRRRARSLSGISVNRGPSIVTVSGHGVTVGLQGAAVSTSTFDVLGVSPLLGRGFGQQDGAPGSNGTIVLSFGTWRRFFNADREIVGQTLILANRLLPNPAEPPRPYTVVGVMPEGFAYPDEQIQFWVAVPWTPEMRGRMLARLTEGASMAAAEAEVGAILRGLRHTSLATTYVFEPPDVAQPVRTPLIILSVATGIVLLIACVNVTGLLFARTAARHREIALRLALGAGRGRVIRHLMTESLVLAVFGGAGGAMFAAAGVRLLKTLATTLTRMDLGVQLAFPRLSEIAIDPTVIGFIVVTSTASCLLLGLAPALRYTRLGLGALRERLGRSSSHANQRRGRHVLVATEVALATVLLVGAVLVVKSFLGLTDVPVGFDSNHVVTFQVALPPDRHPASEAKRNADELVARMEATRAFQAVAYGQPPMVALTESALFRRTPSVPQRPDPGSPELRLVSPQYFEVMGIRVLRGHSLTDADTRTAPRVMLLNETAARREFPGGESIGEQVYLGRDSSPWAIVGVVQDVQVNGPAQDVTPQVYASVDQWPEVFFPLGPYFLVRTQAPVASVLAQVRAAVRGFDREAGVFNVATMDEILSNRVSRPRMYATLLGLFASIAAALAAIGIYGVLAYSVAQQTYEIGVRMALGARAPTVVRLVVGRSLVATAMGVALGLVGAAGLTRYLASLLFGVTSLDPATFGVVAAGFALIAMVAAAIPARRATKVDPLVALRCE
jgi:putative ABC transport system permease protein